MLLLSTDPTDLADRLARTLRLPVRIVLAALVGLRLVTVMIDIPADDAELKAFVEKWSAAGTRNPRANLGV